MVHGNGYYGAGTGQRWLDDVKCQGNETSLLQCKMKQWGHTNCGHREDVGVDCQPGKFYQNSDVSYEELLPQNT